MQHWNPVVPSQGSLESKSSMNPPRCPKDCDGTMQFNPLAGIAPFIGLQPVCCTHCDHQGIVSLQGVQLLFRGGCEYLFSYGNPVATLTVMLTAHAIDMFRVHGIGPDITARRAAEWALLRGQCTGIVNLSLENTNLEDFYRHYCRNKLRPIEGSTTKNS